MFSGRFLEYNEPGKSLSPIILTETPLLPFADAIKPLENLVTDLDLYTFVTNTWLDEQNEIKFALNTDETAAIHIYTREWIPRENSLYYLLNNALRTVDRNTIKPYLNYLKLLLSGLSKIPSYQSEAMSLWRGVQDEDGTIIEQYQNTKKCWWWGFSSCTTNMPTATQFLGGKDNTKRRVLFNIHYRSHVVDIQDLSHFKSEHEVLLLPARYLDVINISELAPGLFIVELVEVSNVPQMIKGIPIPVSFKPTVTTTTATTTAITTKPTVATTTATPTEPTVTTTTATTTSTATSTKPIVATTTATPTKPTVATTTATPTKPTVATTTATPTKPIVATTTATPTKPTVATTTATTTSTATTTATTTKPTVATTTATTTATTKPTFTKATATPTKPTVTTTTATTTSTTTKSSAVIQQLQLLLRPTKPTVSTTTATPTKPTITTTTTATTKPTARIKVVLDKAKNAIPILNSNEKTLEFWQIWTESIPDTEVSVKLAMTSDMTQLSWRVHGPQSGLIQEMVDFFWNVGAPEVEINRLNEVGGLINPLTVGSWVDMSNKGGMDGGWVFPVRVQTLEALKACDEGPSLTKLTEWTRSHHIYECVTVGRDMGASPPRQTEIRFIVDRGTFEAKLALASKAYKDFGFPPIPGIYSSVMREWNPTQMELSVITSSEGFVRMGMILPQPEMGVVSKLCYNNQNIKKFQKALNIPKPVSVQLFYLMESFGYGVYDEGWNVMFHYNLIEG